MESNLQPGRNDPCPCGSGKKFKICCGKLAPVRTDAAGDLAPTELATLLNAGRYGELEHRALEHLARQPESGLHWQLLGVALRELRKDPLPALVQAARCLPDDAGAHLNLGNALGRAGRLDEAASSFGRALRLNPEFAEAHCNLCDVQLEQGLLEAATASCRRAIAIRPDFAEAHRSLGTALWRSGHLDEALASCLRALELRPDFAQAHNTLGNVWMKRACPEKAIASFRSALGIDPDFAEAGINLANALRSVGRLEEAVAAYRRAIEIKPNFVAAHTELATALRLQRRGAEAEASCRMALELDPDSAATLLVLAELRADAARFAEADQYYDRVIALDPDAVEAWAGRARLRRMTAGDDAWLAAAQALAARTLPPQKEMLIRYAIGKYFDDIQDFSNAFVNYRRANELARLCGPAHDRTQLTHNIDLIIRSFDRRWIGRERRSANQSARPVFVVGMLRSGTTLAEQILASHPSVFGAGELSYWGTAAAAFAAAAVSAAPTASAAAGGLLIEVNDATLAGLAAGYLQLLDQLSPDALRVVDKMPTNFLLLGLIHAALPRARIIHMRRNPIDTCLSIYFQHFEAANTYANDLGDLAHYAGEYRRLMLHWRTVLPADAMLEVPYEALVADPETWSRRMLEFVDLPWDPRCLDFHRTERTVITASKWQVRQKINSASVGRWRHYEPFIGPLKALL
jgi:tetratricopeptide (TPR) repeat protein